MFLIIVMVFSACGMIGIQDGNSGAPLNGRDELPADDAYEDNDDKSSPAVVSAGTYRDLKCNDDDWFKIRLTSGQDLTVTIIFDHSEGDLELELWNLTDILDSSQSDTDNETVTLSPVPAGGFYYINVSGYEHDTNNYTMEISNVDITPPRILSRLLVTHISPTSVKIPFTTDEPCTSVIRYGRSLYRIDGTVINNNLVYSHSHILTNLIPSTTYYFWITCTDRYNNTAESGPHIFETQAEVDTEAPTIELVVPEVIIGPTLVIASAADNIGVSKVEFYLDYVYQFTDYANDYEWYFDPSDLINGEYTISAKAYDLVGNTATDEREVTIANPVPDQTPPELDITSDFKRSRVRGGNVSISLTAIDPDSGIDRLAFYVDGEHTGTNIINGEADVLEASTFYWNTYSVTNKQWHTLSVKGFNNDLVAGEDSVSVFTDNPKATMQYPNDILKLKPVQVTRGQVRRQDTYYEVKLYVKNVCGKELYDVRVEDYNFGFQTISSEYGYQQKASYDPNTMCSKITFPIGSLKPGEVKTCVYNMVPVLFAQDPRIDFQIGKETKVKYLKSPSDLIQQKLTYFVPSVEMLPSWWAVNPIPITPVNVLAPMITRDYLVVTQPQNLLWAYNNNDVNELLSELAKFSRHKNAVLGYLRALGGDSAAELQYAINPSYIFHPWLNKIVQGGWNHYITPNWESNGYMLLVGEIEIVPSYVSLNWDIKWDDTHTTEDVKFSDLPYADLNGDGPPDIHVGRIIGNDASKLIKPIKASLGSQLNWPGYGFHRTQALLVSGTGGSYNSFVDNVNELYPIINSQGAAVTNVHWKDSIIMDSFFHNSDQNDMLAAGDIYYDNLDEIIAASWANDKIYIYEPDSTLLKQFTITLDWQDKLAVGDILGTTRDEICILDYSASQIDIYQGYIYFSGGSSRGTRAPPSGSRMIKKVGTININFALWDGFALGDVTGDYKKEIIIADESANKIYIYDSAGTELNNFNCNFDVYDRLLAGDMLPGNKTEIIIADITQDRFYLKNYQGALVDIIEYDLTLSERTAMGDFYNQGMQEIVISNWNDKNVYVIYFNDNLNDWKTSPLPANLPIEPNDGLAVGNILSTSRREIILANNFQNAIHYFDKDSGARMRDATLAEIQNKDIIYFSGHGNIYCWSPAIVLRETSPPADFGSKNPFVFAPSCLTGDYETENKYGDEYNIAEAFLDRGAGAVIGATELSRIPDNTLAGKKFFQQYWTGPNIDIGTAFTELKRDLWPQSFLWKFWVTEYNLYGDPKFGKASGGSRGTVDFDSEHGPPQATGSTLPDSTVELEIPEYNVTTIDGLDYVEIPGGEIWLEDGEYQVPYYTQSVTVPEGYQVQDVTLTERAGLINDTGLNLPYTTFNFDYLIDEELMEGFSSSSVPDRYGWVPEQDFRWELLQNADGSSTLYIIVYPFFYNQKTTDVKFYTEYEFDIDYIYSFVALSQITMDKREYDSSETAAVEISLTNTGSSSTEVILTAEIESYLGSEIITGLDIQSLDLHIGESSTTLWFDTEGFAEGQYKVKVQILDLAGNLLDNSMVSFHITLSRFEIPLGIPIPEFFENGEDVLTDFEFPYTSVVDINVTVEILIRNTNGSIVKVFTHIFEALAPDSSIHIEDTWYSEEIFEEKYFINAYVYFNGKCIISPTIEIMHIEAAIQDLIEDISEMSIQDGIRNSLIVKLENAQKSISKGQNKAAINQLEAFIKEVRGLKGKKILQNYADVLMEDAQLIIDNIS
jgi:hypothetical protein